MLKVSVAIFTLSLVSHYAVVWRHSSAEPTKTGTVWTCVRLGSASFHMSDLIIGRESMGAVE